MNAKQKTRLRAMLHCIAYGLAIASIYKVGFVFVSGMLFVVWVLFWSMVFKDWNER